MDEVRVVKRFFRKLFCVKLEASDVELEKTVEVKDPYDNSSASFDSLVLVFHIVQLYTRFGNFHMRHLLTNAMVFLS